MTEGAAAAPTERTWVDVQKKTFTRWSNSFLRYRALKINELDQDLTDGVLLISLLEILSDKSLGKYNKTPKMKPQKLENISAALKFITSQGIKLVGIGPEDIHDKNLKLILGLIWTLILRFQIQRGGPDANAKAELLEWVRKQVAPYGLRPKNFNMDWTDGKVLSALTDSLQPGTLDYNGLSGNALNDTETAMDTAEREYQITKLMDAIDMVEMPDELAVMTYISLFRDWWNDQARRRAAEEEAERLRKMKLADPSQCFAEGPGLVQAYTNNVAPFTIHAINYFGEPVVMGGDQFAISVVDGSGKAVHFDSSDSGNGLYPVSYTPVSVGQYAVTISLRGENIKGSPFTPNVSGPSAHSTTASGPGVEGRGARIGHNAPFTVQSKDQNGKPVPTGNDPFEVRVERDHVGPVAVDFKDNGNGTYNGGYTPVAPGFYTVTITLAGENIQGSPFHPLIEQGNAAKSFAEGPGLHGGKTDHVLPFRITAVDPDGNRVTSGGDPFEVLISGPEPVTPTVRDNGDGTYDVEYSVGAPGDYEIKVNLHGSPVKDSPFHPHIKQSADANNSYAEGPGLEQLFDNEPGVFTIHAVDKNGNPRTDGGDDFAVAIRNPDGSETAPHVVDNGDGTYGVTYNPETPGDYVVTVALEGQPIKNSPITVNCKSGTDAGLSGFTTFQFTVQTRDKHGQNKTFGGDDFRVTISGPASVEVQTSDNGDGSYSASYSLTQNGSYTVSVHLNGKELNGSPFKQEL
jgi:filamin